MNVRDAIKLLLDHDPEATLCFSLRNSDPIEVTSVEENDEEQVILSSE